MVIDTKKWYIALIACLVLAFMLMCVVIPNVALWNTKMAGGFAIFCSIINVLIGGAATFFVGRKLFKRT